MSPRHAQTWRTPLAPRITCLTLLVGLSVVAAACFTARPEISTPSRSGGPAPEPRERQNVVAIARKHLGAPYRWGGSSPDGFDCSGFVQYIYAQVGVSLPHNAAKQYMLGVPVSRDRLEPGDVVFFDHLRHNGIYVGNGQFIHARRSGKRVTVSTLDEAWYAERWAGARRL
jgi:cell wall-associated NlpC family hydrolase